METQADGRIEGKTERRNLTQMEGQANCMVDERTDGKTQLRTDGRTGRRADGRTDGKKGGCSEPFSCSFTHIYSKLSNNDDEKKGFPGISRLFCERPFDPNTFLPS